MENEIARAVECYDSGRMTRRELVTHLAALAVVFGAAGGSSSSAADSSTFEGLGLNHIALHVTDVPRSRDFYVKHLGLSVTSDCGQRSCFLDCGDQFVALFRAERPADGTGRTDIGGSEVPSRSPLRQSVHPRSVYTAVAHGAGRLGVCLPRAMGEG